MSLESPARSAVSSTTVKSYVDSSNTRWQARFQRLLTSGTAHGASWMPQTGALPILKRWKMTRAPCIDAQLLQASRTASQDASARTCEHSNEFTGNRKKQQMH